MSSRNAETDNEVASLAPNQRSLTPDRSFVRQLQLDSQSLTIRLEEALRLIQGTISRYPNDQELIQIRSLLEVILFQILAIAPAADSNYLRLSVAMDPPGRSASDGSIENSLDQLEVVSQNLFQILANAPFGQTSTNSIPNTIKVPDESHLQSDVELVDETAGSCVICLQNKAICVALPCGHLSYCVECSRHMCTNHNSPKTIGEVRCAHCRHEIHELKRLYM